MKEYQKKQASIKGSIEMLDAELLMALASKGLLALSFKLGLRHSVRYQCHQLKVKKVFEPPRHDGQPGQVFLQMTDLDEQGRPRATTASAIVPPTA